jgi:hypothetical protein
MLKNAAQPASAMDLARWWFFSILAVCRSSVIDRVVVLDKGERRLVVKVLSLPSNPLMRPGEQCDCFPAAVAFHLSTRDTPLCGFEGAFGFAIPTGVKEELQELSLRQQKDDPLGVETKATAEVEHLHTRTADEARQQIPRDKQADEREQVQSLGLADALHDQRPGKSFTKVVHQRREDLFDQRHRIAQGHELEEAGEAPGLQSPRQSPPPEPDGKPDESMPEVGIEKRR